MLSKRSYYNRSSYRKNSIILNSICLLFFFEPKSFGKLFESGYNTSFNSIVGAAYSAAMLFISSIAFIEFFRFLHKEKGIDSLYLLQIVTIVFLCLAVLANGTISLVSLKNLYTRIGLVLFCCIKLRQSSTEFYYSGMYCFGFLSILGVASIFLHPNGFLNSSQKQYAVYFLGSKNSAYCFYFCFILFYVLAKMKDGKISKKFLTLCISILFIAARICDSGNTTIALILMLLFTLFYNTKIISEFWTPAKAIITILVIDIIIYGGTQFELFSHITESIGRDTTFTGRTFLWSQGLEYFKSNPFFGAGDGIPFRINNSIANHAHSEFINCLAKYGIIPFLLLVLSLFIISKRLKKIQNKKYIALLSGLMFINLLHMSFDVYNYNFTIMMVLLINSVYVNQKQESVLEQGVIK